MRGAAGVVLLFAALLLLPGQRDMEAVEGTDARYLEISRAMWVGPDRLVPRLAGAPHLDKPPLTYWAAAAMFALAGPQPHWGRLPSLVAVALTAAALAGFARRWCGGRAALAAALCFLTSGLVYVSSRGLLTDFFQLFFLTGAMLAFPAAVEAPRRPGFATLALALLGASFLAKGPIALGVALAVWLPYLGLTRGRTRLPGRAVALGAALLLVVAAPWYLLVAAHDPGALDEWIRVQLLGRVEGTQPQLGHLHPRAYLLGIWPLGLLPWTPLAALALLRLRGAGRWRDAAPADLYLLLWAVLPIFLFSLSRAQVATYILPAFPAAALAIGRGLERGALGDRAGRLCLIACAALAAGVAAALAAVLLDPALLRSEMIEVGRLRAPGVFGGALAGVAALGLAAGLRRWRAPSSAVLALAVHSALVFALGFSALAPALVSWKEEGELARSVDGAWLFEHRLRRLSALFYFGHPERFAIVDDAWPPEALARLRGDTPAFCLARQDGVAELEALAPLWRVRERAHTVLLANAAAERALARAPER